MKKIEAIIRSTKFEAVRDALAKVDVKFFTLLEVKGYGLAGGERLVYRGHAYDTHFIGRLRLDIITTEDRVDDIIKTILKEAQTGEIGDGKITIVNIDNVYRIRNGEEGSAAL